MTRNPYLPTDPPKYHPLTHRGVGVVAGTCSVRFYLAGINQDRSILPSSVYGSGSGMKAMTAPRGRAENCRARNLFFPSRSTKRYNSKFFSLYQLQIVLLTIANRKNISFSRNYDFISNFTCARGMKDPAAPRRATCIR